MKKLSLLTMILALGLAANGVRATTSRVNSLGGNGDFFEDDSGVLRWYGSLVDYPDEALLESGNFNLADGYWETPRWKRGGPAGGGHFGWNLAGHRSVLAAYYHGRTDDQTVGILPSNAMDDLSLIYALDLGPVTAAVAYGQGSNAQDEDLHRFGAGLRFEWGPHAYFDLAGETYRYGGSLDFAAQTNYNLRARAFLGRSPRLVLVPVVETRHEDLALSELPSNHQRGNWTRLALGLNYFPDTDHLLLAEIGYQDGDHDLRVGSGTLRESWSAWGLKTGFETRILSWLTTRGSLGLLAFEVDTRDQEYLSATDSESPRLRVDLGAALHLGPADLDLAWGEHYPTARFLIQKSLTTKPWLSATARILF